MKVILLKDVANVGHKDEVKEVPRGHAQNFLIPRGFATPATVANLRRLEHKKVQAASDQEAQKEAFKEMLATLHGREVVMLVPVNEQGHLFSGIHEVDIATHLQKTEGVGVQKEDIVLQAPIKEVGTYEVTLRQKDEEDTLTLKVEKA